MSDYLTLSSHIGSAQKIARIILDGLHGGKRASQIMNVQKHLHAASEAMHRDPPTPGMTEAQIKHMVDRFLMWRLPKPWDPDNGVSYKRPNYAHAPADHDWPVGTNLFSATEAEAMVRHMLYGLPVQNNP